MNEIYKSLSLKKNNLDEMFLNLNENPEQMPNKDFRLQLSTIYQIFEDEFGGAFVSEGMSPIRKTNFYPIFDKELKFFVTPVNNFDFYLKSKGSLYRFSSVTKTINCEEVSGYVISSDVAWEYFDCFGNVVDFEDGTDTFNYLNAFTQVVMKIVERLYFIPIVNIHDKTFDISWDIISNSSEVLNYLQTLEIDVADDLFILNTNKNKAELFNHLLYQYLNYIIFKFLFVKAGKFKDAKSAHYFIKKAVHKRYEKSIDVAVVISEWLDEMHIGNYDVVPLIRIEKLEDDKFCFKIEIQNKTTKETLPLDVLESQEEVFGLKSAIAIRNIQKQINYIIRYFPDFMEDFDNIENGIELSLNEVYKFVTLTSYQLQKATIEVILPDDFNKIIVPRASINAKVKKDRESDLQDLLVSNKASTIGLDEILEFSYYVSIGNEKLTIEEFEKEFKDVNGLVHYKNMLVLFDKAEYTNILERIEKQKGKKLTKFELLHGALSKQLGDYDFDYDDAFMRVISELGKVENVEVSPQLQGELRPYQKSGFKWLWTNIAKGFGCCLADDMGLGKTIQVISLLLKLKDEKKLKDPAIVVCPTTLVGNWIKELATFAPNLKVGVFQGVDRELNFDVDVLITTFAILRIDIEQFKKQKFAAVIVDEAQNIKNPDTAQTQAVKILKSDTKIAMTGTPVENRLTELWSIFDFINRGYLGTLKDFQKSYAIPIERFKEYQRAEKLKLSVSPFILRRLKSDKNIISDLPEKFVMDEYCYLKKPQAALYEKVLNDMMNQISTQTGINRRGLIFKLITALKQICNHPYQYLKSGDSSKDMSGKTERLFDLIKNILANDEKLIVFTQYKEMGHILEKIIADELGMPPLFFHGSLTRAQRDSMLEKFEKDNNKKIMLLSLKAGGTGLNLTQATNVVHYDLWWNPAVEDQATDRTYRIGQNKNVMVHRLINLGTFEEKINEMLKTKKELANIAVFEGEKMITELTDDEIYEIFSLVS